MRPSIPFVFAVALAPLSGCGVTYFYIGYEDGGAGGASSSSTPTGGAGTTSTTAAPGGTGGALLCLPGTVQSCYSGLAGTEGQGICKAGTQTCAADGASWGTCEGEVLPQVEDCATPEDEDCDGSSPTCDGGLLWAKRFGDSGDQLGHSVAVDAQGNVIVAGYFQGTIDLGGSGALESAGAADIFVAKLDANGSHLWSRQFGDGADQGGVAVTVDLDGNVLLCGTFQGSIDFGGGALTSAGDSDIYVAKLDASGGHLWSKRFGDANYQDATAIAVDAAGNLALTGEFRGSVDFGGQPLTGAVATGSIFVATLDPSGNHLWSKRFGDGGGQAVGFDPSGAVLVGGVLVGTADFGGGVMQTAGSGDVFVAKLGTEGSHVWSKRFGDAGAQDLDGLAIDGANGVVLTGIFAGIVDFGGGVMASSSTGGDSFLVKLGGNGDHVWSKRFGAGTGSAVAVDVAGNVIVSGSVHGTADFGAGPVLAKSVADIFLVKLGSGGEHIWSREFGDSGTQTSTGIATDGGGAVVVTGYFKGALDLGGSGGPLQSTGGGSAGREVFLAKWNP